jgi:hypothetical protein
MNISPRLVAVAVLLAGLCLAGGCGKPEPARPGTTFDLTRALADLTNVAAFAEGPLGTMRMITTYDRTGGNQDWGNYNNVAADGLVTIADLKGPGCVRRLWMTNVRAERWLFFFDGEKKARFDLTPTNLFGGQFPFQPPLSDKVSGASYCYVPLPYRKSLRIALSVSEAFKKDIMLFYHINYETFGRDVAVATFPAVLSPAETEAIRATQEAWRNGKAALRAAQQACPARWQGDIAPGASAAWLAQDGGGRLKLFWFRILTEPPSALARARLLRELVLKIYWDGMTTPSVEAPLGDFFCNGEHRREFAASALAYVDGAYVCRFPMPFGKSIRAEIENGAAYPVRVEAGYDLQPGAVSPVNYFHAAWNRTVMPGMPHRVAYAEGPGHYVGCYVITIGTDGSWNMLEGDDMMWVDDDKEPSFHGTGLEDYFNGGWYYLGLYEFPLHGLVTKSPIRTTQYRLLLPDRIGFEKRMLLNMEFGDGNRGRGCMSSVGYWYQPQPHPCGLRVPPVRERFPPQDPLEPHALMSGLFELERLGRLQEAREFCLEYAEQFAPAPIAAMAALRAEAYREALAGFDAVSNAYAQFQGQLPNTPIAQQAAQLLWFHAAPSNALLGTHINGQYTVYLDGQLVGKGDSPQELAVHQAYAGPGEHEVALAVTPVRPGAWISMAVRAHGTNVVTDGTWECARIKPPNWPATGGAEWAPVANGADMFPKMMYWAFVPNAQINMQGGRQVIMPPWDGWDAKPGVTTTYLRKRFVVPESGR